MPSCSCLWVSQGYCWVIFQGALYIFGAFEKTWNRLVSQSVASQESLTSLEVLISFSTSLSCLPRPRIYTE